MSLENINAPQFVDFSSIETFDLFDGADFCFGKNKLRIKIFLS